MYNFLQQNGLFIINYQQQKKIILLIYLQFTQSNIMQPPKNKAWTNPTFLPMTTR